MSAFSDTNVNKFIALSLIFITLIALVLSSWFRFTLPPVFDTIVGVCLGYASHALGVVNGVSATNEGITNGANAVKEGIANGASAVNEGVTSGTLAITKGINEHGSGIPPGH